MKNALFALLLSLTLVPFAHAQIPIDSRARPGSVRVGVVLWDVKQFSVSHHSREWQSAPNIPGPTVTTSDRNWNSILMSRSGSDSKVELRLMLKAYPHRNPDGTFTVIVDLTVTENGGPNGPVTHRLWNTVTTGKNGVGAAPPHDVMFLGGLWGDTRGYAYIGQMRLEDGTERDAMVSVVVT